MLELAVVGLLHREPMHGYQLRAELKEILGTFRTVSYGTLYPILRRLENQGFAQVESGALGRKARKVYRLTAAGRQHFADLLADASHGVADDDNFAVRMAFFTATPADTRLRVLQARRRVLEERRDRLEDALTAAETHAASVGNVYSRGLKGLELDATHREIHWLNELISQE